MSSMECRSLSRQVNTQINANVLNHINSSYVLSYIILLSNFLKKMDDSTDFVEILFYKMRAWRTLYDMILLLVLKCIKLKVKL